MGSRTMGCDSLVLGNWGPGRPSRRGFHQSLGISRVAMFGGHRLVDTEMHRVVVVSLERVDRLAFP